MVKNPEIPQDERYGEESAFNKTPISEFIFTLVKFLEIEKFAERMEEIADKEKRINTDHLSKNFEVIFNLVRKQCTEAYLRTLPLKEVAFNLQVFSQEVRENWFEQTMDQKSDPKITQKIMKDLYTKTQSSFDSYADIIHKSVKENFEEVIHDQAAKQARTFVEFFTRILIHECFGDSYENGLKLAEYSQWLGSGARDYLVAILQNLQELKESSASIEDQEQIEGLMVIGNLIWKLIKHSTLHRFMEILYKHIGDVVEFQLAIENLIYPFGFGYHAEQVQQALRKVVNGKGELEKVLVKEKPGEQSTNKTSPGGNKERKTETAKLLDENEYEFKELHN